MDNMHNIGGGVPLTVIGMQKFLVGRNIPVAAGTALFLHDSDRKQCQIDFVTLPRDSRTLMKVMT